MPKSDPRPFENGSWFTSGQQYQRCLMYVQNPQIFLCQALSNIVPSKANDYQHYLSRGICRKSAFAHRCPQWTEFFCNWSKKHAWNCDGNCATRLQAANPIVRQENPSATHNVISRPSRTLPVCTSSSKLATAYSLYILNYEHIVRQLQVVYSLSAYASLDRGSALKYLMQQIEKTCQGKELMASYHSITFLYFYMMHYKIIMK